MLDWFRFFFKEIKKKYIELMGNRIFIDIWIVCKSLWFWGIFLWYGVWELIEFVFEMISVYVYLGFVCYLCCIVVGYYGSWCFLVCVENNFFFKFRKKSRNWGNKNFVRNYKFKGILKKGCLFIEILYLSVENRFIWKIFFDFWN